MSERIDRTKKTANKKIIPAEQLAQDSHSDYQAVTAEALRVLGLLEYPGEVPRYRSAGDRGRVLCVLLEERSRFEMTDANAETMASDNRVIYNVLGAEIERCADAGGFRSERERATVLTLLVRARKKLGNTVALKNEHIPTLTEEQVHEFIEWELSGKAQGAPAPAWVSTFGLEADNGTDTE